MPEVPPQPQAQQFAREQRPGGPAQGANMAPEQAPRRTPAEAVRNFNAGCRTVIRDMAQTMVFSSITLFGLGHMMESQASGNTAGTIIWTLVIAGNALGTVLSTIDAFLHLSQTVQGKPLKPNIIPGILPGDIKQPKP